MKKHRAQELRQRRFLAAYADCGTIAQAARAAKVHFTRHYAWMHNDPTYPARFELAHEKATDGLEKEARRRAIEGVQRLVFHEGKPIIDPRTNQPYVEHRYSDVLMIFLLKGARPEKYRERKDVRTEGHVEHEHRHEVKMENLLSPEVLAEALNVLDSLGLKPVSTIDVESMAIPLEKRDDDGGGNGKPT